MKKGIIVFLIMAVLGLSAVFIFAQKSRTEKFGAEMGFGGRGFERIAQKLNLTDEQKTEVKAILEDSKTRVLPLMESLRENRKQAEILGADGVFDEEQVNKIAVNQSETMKLLFIEKEKTKARIFAVLTPEQREQAVKMKNGFKKRFKDRLEKRFGGKEISGEAEE